MKILIPTRGRPDRQSTALTLALAGFQPILVLNSGDTNHYGFATVKVQADNIADKRQAIVQQFGSDKMVMVDDDVRFFTRDPRSLFKTSSPSDIRSLFQRIEQELEIYAHVGTASRFMANRRPPDHEIGGKYIRILGYNFNLVKGAPVPQYRFPGHEDHDYNMQLQRMGYPNLVLTCYANDDVGQFAPGGCSTWRTPESDIIQMQDFGRAWPGIVTFGRPNARYPAGRMRIGWTQLKRYWNTSIRRSLL